MLTSCPGCEFVFDHSSAKGKCPRCGTTVGPPEETDVRPETAASAPPRGPAGASPERPALLTKPQAAQAGGPAEELKTSKERGAAQEAAPAAEEGGGTREDIDELPMAPLKTRVLVNIYDNLQAGIYICAIALITVLFTKIWFHTSFTEPSTFQEAMQQMARIRTATAWIELFLFIFIVAVIYHFQVYVPHQYGRTRGQEKYGISLAKSDGRFTYGTFILRALGQSFNVTLWIYIFTRIFRRGSPDNDNIRGLEDIFSDTKQVITGRTEGKPVERLLIFFMVCAGVVILAVVVVNLMLAGAERSRAEQRARLKAFQERRAEAKGFESTSYYAARVAEVKEPICGSDACVSSYENYKTVYLGVITELGPAVEDIIIHYSRTFQKGGINRSMERAMKMERERIREKRGGMESEREMEREKEREREAASRETINILFLNGVCYREKLLADKLITQDTKDFIENTVRRSFGVRIKDYDAMCPVNSTDELLKRMGLE